MTRAEREADFKAYCAKQDELQIVRDKCLERLGDDAMYPQIYLEQIARRDDTVFADFVDDILNDMGDEWIAELAEDGISLEELGEVIREEMQEAWREFHELSKEEQKEIIDLEEIDWCRNQARQSR